MQATIKFAVGLFSIVSCLLALQGCSRTDEQAAGARPQPVVICVTAASREVTDFDDFVGKTEAFETVQVQARVSGFLRTIEFADGQLVEKGDLLATIEPEEYEATHAMSLATIKLWESKLVLANSSFARFKELRANNSVSQSEYDESEAAVKEAESQIAAARAAADKTALDLKYTNVYAPISGRIDRAFITPGNLVSGGLGAGTVLTRIVNDTPTYAYVEVDERSILEYKRLARSEGKAQAAGGLKELNIPCLLQLQDEDDYLHEGFLDFAENQVDSETGSVRVRGVFENDDHLLQGGLFVHVRIPRGKPYTGVMIPEQCIAVDQSDRVAYVVNDKGEVELRKLTLGGRFGEERSIREGISAGEKVIYQGIQKVRPGMAVQAEMLPSQKTTDAPPAAAVSSDTETENAREAQ